LNKLILVNGELNVHMFGSAMSKIDFEWIGSVKLILAKIEMKVK
jgi:hypothetical protein